MAAYRGQKGLRSCQSTRSSSQGVGGDWEGVMRGQSSRKDGESVRALGRCYRAGRGIRRLRKSCEVWGKVTFRRTICWVCRIVGRGHPHRGGVKGQWHEIIKADFSFEKEESSISRRARAVDGNLSQHFQAALKSCRWLSFPWHVTVI